MAVLSAAILLRKENPDNGRDNQPVEDRRRQAFPAYPQPESGNPMTEGTQAGERLTADPAVTRTRSLGRRKGRVTRG